MDNTQKAVIVGCLLTMVLMAGGAFYYNHWTTEQELAKSQDTKNIAICAERIKRTNQYSLVLTDDNVRAGLECAEKYPQFKPFKQLFDERSPNSPTRKSDS
ncbi:hypothetical protein [Ochrobactrum soli]|uniref:hypothetical protein n=1 Tax=Ochrobactrum soli TaxID=2448455 RepID=UPI000D68FB3C|nr:hypothetical protein [[Ochrobactrum] soli]